MYLSCRSIFSIFLFVQKAYMYLNLFTSFKIFASHINLSFGDATTGFPAKGRMRNECRNFILMTRHYLDLGSAADWLNQISRLARPIRSTAQIWEVTRHQYGISALVSQTSFGGKTSGSVPKCRLFSQGFSIRKKILFTIFYQIYYIL